MKKSLLTLTLLLLSFNLLNSKDTAHILADDNPQYLISITHGGEFKGEIKIELFPEVAPKHCHNFDSLVSIDFYNGTAFHRVIPGFMIQGGDPNSRDRHKSTWGFGDPSQTKVPAEFNEKKHLRGILSAARASDPNSATSQFFICVVDYPSLDWQYTVYGNVLEGMDIVDYIVNVERDYDTPNPVEKVEMTVSRIYPSGILEKNESPDLVKLYPNPTQDELIIENLNSAEIMSFIRLLSLNGKLVLELKSPNPNSNKIDLSDLSTGIYIVEISTNNKVIRKKILINK